MIWRCRKPRAKQIAKHRWHKWFAWYPVRIPTEGRMSGMHKVWLTSILRKGKYSCGYEGCWWYWEYKAMEE